MLEKKWILKPQVKTEIVDELQLNLGIHRGLCQLLAQRGISSFEEAKSFFRPNEQLIHNPMSMKNMEKAVERISEAFENGEKIMIYGDYDVDGTTAVAMVYSFLTQFYDNLIYYIPDRYAEGYGVSFKSIDYAEEVGVKLMH